MAVSEEIPCLDVVGHALGNCRRNRMAISLWRFHQKRVVVPLRAGSLGAQSGPRLAKRGKAQTEKTTALSRLKTGVLDVARGVWGAMCEFMAGESERSQLRWLRRIKPPVTPRGKNLIIADRSAYLGKVDFAFRHINGSNSGPLQSPSRRIQRQPPVYLGSTVG